jgi:hypothetical protein
VFGFIWVADKTDSLRENADEILSPTLSKGEGDEIRRVLVGFIGKLFEDNKGLVFRVFEKN